MAVGAGVEVGSRVGVVVGGSGVGDGVAVGGGVGVNVAVGIGVCVGGTRVGRPSAISVACCAATTAACVWVPASSQIGSDTEPQPTITNVTSKLMRQVTIRLMVFLPKPFVIV